MIASVKMFRPGYYPAARSTVFCADVVQRAEILKSISSSVQANLKKIINFNTQGPSRERQLYSFSIGRNKYDFKLIDGKNGYVVLQEKNGNNVLREELVERASLLIDPIEKNELKDLVIATSIQSLAEPVEQMEDINRGMFSLELEGIGVKLINRLIELPPKASALGEAVSLDDFAEYIKAKKRSDSGLEQAVEDEKATGKILYAYMGRNQINFFQAA